jgi:hypothetical protein
MELSILGVAKARYPGCRLARMSNTRGKGLETSLKQYNILMQSEVGKVVESQRALEKQLELVEMHQAEVSSS